jgi:predicted peptidase/glyoxylase-like metal-dependent hydrolase (beta-lactamase superfamily II)
MSEQQRYERIAASMSKEIIFAGSGMALPYRKFTPVLEPGKKYPLVLFLHGMGQRGHENEAHLLDTSGAHLYAEQAAQAENPCYVFAPQCPADAAWMHPGIPELLKQLVDEAIANDAVDPARVYVTGLSMGAYGTWNLIARYPNTFAAAIPICGAGTLEAAGKVQQLPVWAFHAADDDVVPVASEIHSRTSAYNATVYGTRLMVDACRAAGSANVKYTEYPAGMVGARWFGPHAAWEETYRDDEVRRWLFAQKRTAAAPTEENSYADIAATMTREIIFDGRGMALPYRKFTSARKPGEKVPLVLFLHGAGERGQDNEAQITKTGGAFLYAAPEAQAETACCVVAPQCPTELSWVHPGMPELLKKLVEDLLARDSVDPMRVYVTGLSMGGFGTWNLIARYPSLFAAAMPICGAGKLEAAEKIGQMPVWAFHAADDPVVPVAREMKSRTNPDFGISYGTRLMAQACRTAGCLNVKYTEYPAGMIGEKWGHPHASWQEVYRDGDVRRWLFGQHRAARMEYRSVSPGVWALEDASGDSLYVVDGKSRALVIDTGMAQGDIRTAVEKLTPRPYDLALTHGHGDHSWHAGHFEKIYLSMADKDMLSENRFTGQAETDPAKLFPLADGDGIDLGGGIVVKAVALPGHTPGSVLFVDECHKCVFAGDALGSGTGVWMQVPGASTLSDYAKSIRAAKEKLVQMGVEPAGWAFLAGHDGQKYTNGYNPVSFELMDDMAALCDKLVSGEIAGSDDTGLPPEMAARFGHTRKAAHGKAAMLYRPEQLK